MGSVVCADELMKEEILPKNPISVSEIANGICVDILESKNVAMLSQSPKSKDNQRPSIGPGTPDSSRENAEQNHDLLSPLTVLSLPPNAPCLSSPSPMNCTASPDGSNLETPKEALFDSFAPGPDKFMLAPHHRKYREESRTHVVRRLNFACGMDLVKDFSHESGVETSSDEDRLFKIVYETILDSIFSEQKEVEHVVKLSTQVLDSDGLGTPKSAQIFSGVAETCPGAPMKSGGVCRNIDKELCRKLEF